MELIAPQRRLPNDRKRRRMWPPDEQRRGRGVHPADGDEAAFLDLRPLLFSIAYQMTGSVVESEDIVSEVYVRLRRARDRGTEIQSLKAYLSTATTRLSIDHLKSERVQREVYVGPWMPEPLVSEAAAEGFERVELADSLSMAFLVLLENLSPTERAVFVLREVFVFDYPQIATIIGKSEPYCRQLLHRARSQIEARRPRFDTDKAEATRLAGRFFTAVQNGDLEPLVDLLAADVVAYGDGGGNGPSLPQPVNGRDKVIRLLSALAATIPAHGLHVEQVTVNGQPGALIQSSDGRLLNVMVLDILDRRIQAVRSIVNPDKLHHLGPLIGPDHPLRGGTNQRRRPHDS